MRTNLSVHLRALDTPVVVDLERADGSRQVLVRPNGYAFELDIYADSPTAYRELADAMNDAADRMEHQARVEAVGRIVESQFREQVEAERATT